MTSCRLQTISWTDDNRLDVYMGLWAPVCEDDTSANMPLFAGHFAMSEILVETNMTHAFQYIIITVVSEMLRDSTELSLFLSYQLLVY